MEILQSKMGAKGAVVSFKLFQAVLDQNKENAQDYGHEVAALICGRLYPWPEGTGGDQQAVIGRVLWSRSRRLASGASPEAGPTARDPSAALPGSPCLAPSEPAEATLRGPRGWWCSLLGSEALTHPVGIPPQPSLRTFRLTIRRARSTAFMNVSNRASESSGPVRI